MAIITQKYMFQWKDLQNIGDLKRLEFVINNLPDEKLISRLSELRGNGRNTYNITAMWNSILAGIVFQHTSIESLRRELFRNEGLRQICGFDPFIPAEITVPNSWNYTRFLKNLFKLQNEVDNIFNELVSNIKELLPDYGKVLAHDGKALSSLAKHRQKEFKKRDGRRDVDADYGVKEYSGVNEEGKLWNKTKTWFGYKLHLIIDANYELPVCFDVTKASVSETPKAHELLNKIEKNHKDILDYAEYFLSDKGNDDVKLINKLWEEYKIKPVIDIRNMWKDPDKTKGLSTGENVVYNYKGEVFCVCPKTGNLKSMAYGGYEKDRSSLRYLCPVLHYGIECKGQKTCEIKKFVRIKLKEDKRIFTPLARPSYKWKKVYKKRTSIERVNSRIDEIFCFEKHFIRGLTKMKIRISITFLVMLAMAIGKIKDNKTEILSCFTKAA